MTPAEIAALRALMARATPGPYYQAGLPWFQTASGVLAGSPDPYAGYMIADTETWEGERAEHLDNNPNSKVADADDDAALIVAALNALPALLSLAEDAARYRAALAFIESRETIADGVRGFVDVPHTKAMRAMAEAARAALAPAGQSGAKTGA